MPERNIELLQKTMQYIKDHPEQHNQDIWVNYCGTYACFAGWAAQISGWSVQEIIKADMQCAGARLLGLKHYTEGVILFDAENTVPMLELMVKDLVNGDVMRSLEQYRTEARNA